MTHAIVVGGSLAGMCAARVLGDFFDTVTVFDRDRYPDDVAHRTGVPQSHHAHALLAGGRREPKRLFPGFDRPLVGRGPTDSISRRASRSDVSGDGRRAA